MSQDIELQLVETTPDKTDEEKLEEVFNKIMNTADKIIEKLKERKVKTA